MKNVLYRTLSDLLLLLGLLSMILALSGCRVVDTLLGRSSDTFDLPPVGFCTDTTESCVEAAVTPASLSTPTPLVFAGPVFPSLSQATTTAIAGIPTPSPVPPPLSTVKPAATRSAPPAVTSTVPFLTHRPTPLSTSPAPAIQFFQADVAQADPGQTITLTWATTDAITVTLWRMAPTGQFGHSWNVPLSGSFAYPIADFERNSVNFTLFASAADDAYVMNSLILPLTCPFDWFFPDAPHICPTAAARQYVAAEQPLLSTLLRRRKRPVYAGEPAGDLR